MDDGAGVKVRGRKGLGSDRAKLERDGRCRTSSGQRHFCTRCASALWMYAPEWPDLIHPFASAIDSALPVPPSSVHLMLRYKADWVRPQFGRGDQRYSEYPELSIEAWHRSEERRVGKGGVSTGRSRRSPYN